MEVTYLLAMWCPVYKGRDSNLDLGAELGNSSCDVKGKPYKCSPRRGKVPMRMMGAHISDEAPVMGVERRGCISSREVLANRETGRSV